MEIKTEIELEMTLILHLKKHNYAHLIHSERHLFNYCETQVFG